MIFQLIELMKLVKQRIGNTPIGNVVVTIPVYLTYDYDNFGSTAKKVDVKVTFSSNVADDSTEGDDTTTEGGDSNTGNSNGADDLLDDSMGI